MGWRGEDGQQHLRGAPNPKQWEAYAAHNCVFQQHLPESMHYMRNWNRTYLDFAKEKGWRQKNEPIQLTLYSDALQSFRLAAQGKSPGRQPPDALRERISTYFDPLPFWYPPLEDSATDLDKFPLHAVTQRPMAMYHSWDSQNAWLRQIHSHNFLQVNPVTAREAGLAEAAWCWVESPWGRVRCQISQSEAVEPGTVWTWNAIGKADGAWQLEPGADESRRGFLLNHLIAESLPWGEPGGKQTISNSDPVTGQAGWYDVRVRLIPLAPGEAELSWPQMPAAVSPPGVLGRASALRIQRAPKGARS
jgi:anaerobic selenocysteine-containing dehydrogenase